MHAKYNCIVNPAESPVSQQPQPDTSNDGSSSASPASDSKAGASQIDTPLLETVSKFVGVKEAAAGILVFVAVWKIFEQCRKGDIIKIHVSPYVVCCYNDPTGSRKSSTQAPPSPPPDPRDSSSNPPTTTLTRNESVLKYPQFESSFVLPLPQVAKSCLLLHITAISQMIV